MNELRILGIVLILLGVLAFSYEGFITYRTREKVFEAGPVEVTTEKTKKIPVAPTLGTLALVGGITLLVLSAGKRA